jgi:NAD+ synthase
MPTNLLVGDLTLKIEGNIMEHIKNKIVAWLKYQNEKAGTQGFVVGVSGGVDSAVVSTLCALTSQPVYAVTIPITYNWDNEHLKRAKQHLYWISSRFPNVKVHEVNLTGTWEKFEYDIKDTLHLENNTEEEKNLVSANIQSRLRMVALYAFANAKKYLVAGTGNKVEDFGIGFCTKGGDSMVDLSPIGDLMKSEVRELGKHLGIQEEIVNAIPSDGLWTDDRSDEAQIGASYDELEWAMNWLSDASNEERLIRWTERKNEVLSIYLKRHNANAHKMSMPPICKI